MAHPAEIQLSNLSGSWLMDKTKSDDLDAVLKLQGIGWLMRKTINASSVTLNFTQSEELDSSTNELVQCVTMQQALVGGIKGAPQKTSLNWTDSRYNDPVFGSGTVRSCFVKGVKTSSGKVQPDLINTVELKGERGPGDEKFLAQGVVVDTRIETTEQYLGKAFLQDFLQSTDYGWATEQLWALEEVDGNVCLTRKIVVTKGGSTEVARLVYRYAS
ncbi:hypothetical protein ETB97_010087 [Aspergillus alliaceus]|uniref:Uncharacterized protein n=2 Tax=Petromyces alliaceus TaxID=209559 RepID=A0A8H6A7X4_PETAA|nr:hypothetical protein ETB97_010087 [Aspergillus burnettii]